MECSQQKEAVYSSTLQRPTRTYQLTVGFPPRQGWFPGNSFELFFPQSCYIVVTLDIPTTLLTRRYRSISC